MLRFVKELFASKPEAPAPANLVLISPNGKYVEGRAMLKTTRALLDAGLARFHLREYDWTDAQHLEFIDALPKAYWSRIVLHGRPELALARPLGGVHLRAGERRHRAWPKELGLSCSCHSYDELQQTAGPCAYALLSPLFPSVSKSGYQPQRTVLELAAIRSHWRAQGGCPVYALGGVTAQTAPQARDLGFDGIAFLGEVWGAENPVKAFLEIERAWSKTPRPLLRKY